MDSSTNVISRRASNILPSDVADPEPARIAVRVRVDAGGDIDGLVDVVKFKVAEGDVVNSPTAGVGLDPRSVGGVGTFDVFEENVVDVVHCSIAN